MDSLFVLYQTSVAKQVTCFDFPGDIRGYGRRHHEMTLGAKTGTWQNRWGVNGLGIWLEDGATALLFANIKNVIHDQIQCGSNLVNINLIRNEDAAESRNDDMDLYITNVTYNQVNSFKLLHAGQYTYLYGFEAEAQYIKVHCTHFSGTVAFDLYLDSLDAVLELELESAYGTEYGLTAPIVLRVEKGQVYFGDSDEASGLTLNQGWNRTVFELDLTAEVPSAVMSLGGATAEVPVNSQIGDYICYVDIRNTGDGTAPGDTAALMPALLLLVVTAAAAGWLILRRKSWLR